jgi:crossover junction endodeoxyribonuclease RusA
MNPLNLPASLDATTGLFDEPETRVDALKNEPGSRVVRFRVVGIPQPQGSAKAFTPRGWTRPVITSDNPRLKQWRDLVALFASAAFGIRAPFEGPVVVRVVFDLPRPKSMSRKVVYHTKKPDCDKLVRGIFDSLSHVVFRDDSQVVEVLAKKRYADGTSVGVEVTVEAL